MKNKIITLMALLSVSLMGPAVVPSIAYAANGCRSTESKTQVIDSIGEAGGNCKDDGVDNVVNAIVTILSYVAGVAAIIMIIYSGLRYITSGGDTGKVSSAKNALIYALIGIIVVVLAQLIVRFVVAHTDNAANNNGCSIGYHRSEDGKKCLAD
jgi:hypothetical protein